MTPRPAADRVRGRAQELIQAAVADVVEGVFDVVADVHAAAAQSCTAPSRPPALDEDVAGALHRPGRLVVGLGLVVAPRADEGRPLSLQWWQVDPEGGRLRTLEPDLRPSSLGYYDYTAAEWFDVPRRTGRRHVVGPYVDVHGTGRYLLTFTRPLVVGGEFLGVVGADVPVSRFETHLLRVLGPSPQPFVLLNDEDRVVLSTSSRWLAGGLLPEQDAAGVDAERLPGAPWRLHVLGVA